MKMSYWMVLPLILGISTLSVACGNPTPEVEEGVGEEEMMEEGDMEAGEMEEGEMEEGEMEEEVMGEEGEE